MNKLVVGIPLFYYVPAQFFSRWASMDQSVVEALITVDGAYITTSVETIVNQAFSIKEDWDRLVIIEHDMLPPLDALTRIAHYSSEHAIVGSLYFQHAPPHTALVYIEQSNGDYDPITPETVKAWCADPMLYRCDATGFGLMSIARHVLEDWPEDVPMFGIGADVGSHDLWFCRKARELGHKVYVDSGIVCEHLTQVPIGLSHNQSAPAPDGVQISEFAFSEA